MKKVVISPSLLADLIDRLEERIPTLTTATHIAPYQHEANERILSDRALVKAARRVLHPKAEADDFAGYTLEECRFLREVALHAGDAGKAFALATAIDIKRGFYK